MASAGKITLFSKEALAASETGARKSAELHQTDFIAVVRLANSAGGNMSVKFQHSPDGVDWTDLATVVQAGDGSEFTAIAVPVLPNVRADVTVTAGTADVYAELYYDKRK